MGKDALQIGSLLNMAKMDIIVRTATSCMPLSREQLYSDVICKRIYGNISRVWHFPGHILIATNDHRKLFTFDCIPVSLQQAFDQKSLDISNAAVPLLDCLSLSDDIIALVDIRGGVKLWKFTDSCVWKSWGSLELCQSNQAEVVSVSFVGATHELVWCEKRESPSSLSPPEASGDSSTTHPFSLSSTSANVQYCVCRKQLHSSFKSTTLSTLAPSSILMYNSPCCQLQLVSENTLFLSFKYDKNKVSLYMIFDLASDLMTLYVGEECITSTIKDGIDFQQVAVSCLACLVKSNPGGGDCGTRADESKGLATVLSSNGAVDVFNCKSVSKEKTEVTRRCVQLMNFDLCPTLTDDKFWFLHGKLLGMVSDSNISLYNVEDGNKMSVTGVADIPTKIRNVIPSRSPVFLAWILTDDQLYGIQGRDSSIREVLSTPDKLPQDDLLQTDILRLARLQQRKCEGYDFALAEELRQLKARWQEEHGGMHEHSEVLQALAPYVDEYWRLDNLTKALLDSDSQQHLIRPKQDVDSPATVVATTMEARAIGRAVTHARLLWLSQVYPRELLTFLCRDISFQNGIVDHNQLRQWQMLIGLDGGDLMHFEFVCRLLFHLEPGSLLDFVKCAESVSEQAVGVSAFIRKKHSLIYYKAACECLPDCQTSTEPKRAASSKAKLIMATECENCEELSLKCYLQHHLWDEALSMLREQADKEDKLGLQRPPQIAEGSPRISRSSKQAESKLPTLLYITITALTQSQVLSKFVPHLFSLMPNWKSLLSFSKVATGQPEIRQQQLATAARDVFASEGDSRGVPLASVRSQLLDLVKGMKDDS